MTTPDIASSHFWLDRANLCKLENDITGEEAALDRLLDGYPRSVVGHFRKADCRANAGDEAAACLLYTKGLSLADGLDLPTEIAVELRRAELSLAPG